MAGSPEGRFRGEITSIFSVSRDITRRKKAKEALRQARDLLADRVVERTKELLASLEKLRLLTAQTVNAQEKEQSSISREQHDEAGQALITLKYGLAAIQSELPKADVLPRQRLADSMKIIDQTMVHIRALPTACGLQYWKLAETIRACRTIARN